MGILEACAQVTILDAKELYSKYALIAAIILMNRDGVDISTISKYTGLSARKIKKLSKERTDTSTPCYYETFAVQLIKHAKDTAIIETMRAIAKKMLKQGIPDSSVCKYTKLTAKEVEAISKE